jgi:lysine-specific demethylase 8
MKTVQIARKQNLTPEDLMRDHLQGVGQPVIITDAIQCWPAFSKWTFDFFKESYGSDFATATPGLHSGLWKLTKLGSYIDYLDTTTEELPGFWIDPKTGKPSAPQPYDSPFYLMGWMAFDHAELYHDIRPAPPCIPDWTLSLTPALRDVLQLTCDHVYWAVYIGPEGSLSKLHTDFAHTHGYLA